MSTFTTDMSCCVNFYNYVLLYATSLFLICSAVCHIFTTDYDLLYVTTFQQIMTSCVCHNFTTEMSCCMSHLYNWHDLPCVTSLQLICPSVCHIFTTDYVLPCHTFRTDFVLLWNTFLQEIFLICHCISDFYSMYVLLSCLTITREIFCCTSHTWPTSVSHPFNRYFLLIVWPLQQMYSAVCHTLAIMFWCMSYLVHR